MIIINEDILTKQHKKLLEEWLMQRGISYLFSIKSGHFNGFYFISLSTIIPFPIKHQEHRVQREISRDHINQREYFLSAVEALQRDLEISVRNKLYEEDDEDDY